MSRYWLPCLNCLRGMYKGIHADCDGPDVTEGATS